MDFTPYAPTDKDRQESPQPFAETNGCMSFACVHNCEIQAKVIYGVETDWNEQIVVVGSGTSPISGNSLQNVFNWISSKGLVLTSVYPEPEDFTVSQFYALPNPNIVATGALWLNQWSIQTSLVASNGGKPLTPSGLQTVFNSLTDTPTLITIDLNFNGWQTGYHQFHEVVLLNDKGDYFDSYSTLIKNLDGFKVYYGNKLIIKPKQMPNAEFIKNGTTNEYGFYLPALSEDALKDKAMNFGINILNPDGSINFTTAKQVSGL